MKKLVPVCLIPVVLLAAWLLSQSPAALVKRTTHTEASTGSRTGAPVSNISGPVPISRPPATGARVPGGLGVRRARAVAAGGGARIGVPRGGCGDRLEGGRRAGAGVPVAGCRQVALARRRGAEGSGGLDGVGRAGRTR